MKHTHKSLLFHPKNSVICTLVIIFLLTLEPVALSARHIRSLASVSKPNVTQKKVVGSCLLTISHVSSFRGSYGLCPTPETSVKDHESLAMDKEEPKVNLHFSYLARIAKGRQRLAFLDLNMRKQVENRGEEVNGNENSENRCTLFWTEPSRYSENRDLQQKSKPARCQTFKRVKIINGHQEPEAEMSTSKMSLMNLFC